MKCTIPEISWHNRDPVLSVDVQPVLNNEYYRLASGGTDSHVLIWHLRILENGATSVEAVSDLTRHQRAVNVVRWSPSGQYLASGDDDANIIVWQQKADALSEMIDGETQDKEKWSVFKVLRGHKEDVYDISWSPNSLKLVSGSVDNTAIIWDLSKGTNDNILTDHKGFVQGVSWDPQGEFIASLSSDRTCRIFNETGKQVKSRISKGCLPVSESHSLHGQIVRYYHDDTFKSFFRRLSFTPDGNLLVTPAGCFDSGQPNKPLYATYIFVTNLFTQPAAILPSPGQYTIAIKCCPILFELRPDGPESAISLPYRMVIAVATRSSVVLYDTQQLTPFAVISNIHYARLTDLAWSQDGRILTVSSTDGFCSLVTFEPNELGTEYTKEESDEENMDVSVTEEVVVESVVEEKVEPKKEEKKRSSFLKQWAAKKCTENKVDVEKKLENDEKKDVKKIMKEANTNIINLDESPPKKKPNIDSPLSKTSTPAKLIAVRRKPRDQMEITKFFKSPNEPSAKKLVLDSNAEKTDLFSSSGVKKEESVQPAILQENSVTQEAWENSKKMVVDLSSDIILIEDSQDMKLVLEESTSDVGTEKHSSSLEDFEKFYENQNKECDKKDKTVSEENHIEDNDKTNSKINENADTKDKNTEKCDLTTNVEQTTEVRDKLNKKQKSEDQSSISEEKQNTTDQTTLNEKVATTNKENTEETSTSSLKCDLESNSHDPKTVNDIKNKINDLQIQPGTIQRKKVPFITLSSPKSKKKTS